MMKPSERMPTMSQARFRDVSGSGDAVLLDRTLVHLDSKSRALRHSEISIYHSQRFFHQIAAERSLGCAEFNKHGTPLKRVQVQRRGGDEVARPGVRDQQHIL